MDGAKPRLLLDCCCGPCSTAVCERLVERFDVVCYWYNPNIQPREEWERRLVAMREVAIRTGMELIVDDPGAAGEAAWLAAVAGLEDEPEGGARCDVCFAMRLKLAAAKAAELGCRYFTSTLTVSPHKPASRIHPIGEAAASTCDEDGPEYLAEDFKKRDGFRRSIELSKEYDLYRQNYCGCMFSRREQKQNE